jgi:hypothetical protein
MARPPLALGHHGSIKVDRDDGRSIARCRFRDLDGVTGRVARWGTSKTGAQAALQEEPRQRTASQIGGDRVEISVDQPRRPARLLLTATARCTMNTRSASQ